MALKNRSVELTIRKDKNKLQCHLTNLDYPAMGRQIFTSPLSPINARDIRTSFNKVISLARKETTAPDAFECELYILGAALGSVLQPVLEHFNLVELKGKASLNLTLSLDKDTVKIPWELAMLFDENEPLTDENKPFHFLCQRMNIGRMMEIQRKKGVADTSNAKKGPRERRALVVGSNYKNSRFNLEFAEDDVHVVHKQLGDFGKKNKLKVLPLLVGGNAKKSVIEKRFKDGLGIFHFSGHGNSEGNIGEISLYKRQRLSSQNLDEMLQKLKIKAPKFSFMNACETCLGVQHWAHAMASNGGRALIGTFWSVVDHDSTDFSTAFYRNFFAEGKAIGESVRMAREETAKKIKEEDYFTWLAFVLYGSPTLKASDILD